MPFRIPCKGFGIPLFIKEIARYNKKLQGAEKYSQCTACDWSITKLAVKIWDRSSIPNSKEVTKTLSAIKAGEGGPRLTLSHRELKWKRGVCMGGKGGWKKTIHLSPRPTSYTGCRQSLQPHYSRHRWLSFVAKVHRKAFRSEPLNSGLLTIKEKDGGGEGNEGGGSWRFTHRLPLGLLPHSADPGLRTRVCTSSRAVPAPDPQALGWGVLAVGRQGQ